MSISGRSVINPSLRWYLGRDDVDEDSARLEAGGPLALVGGPFDDLVRFADRLAPDRPVVDLYERTPSANELRALYAAHPETILLAQRHERVAIALGVIVQPWVMLVSPLTARPQQALPLLREAIAQLGVTAPLEELGDDFVERLDAYAWPYGLREIREMSWRLGAVLESGNLSAAARRHGLTRQAFSRYLHKRFGDFALG
jgi:hypothetical protein